MADIPTIPNNEPLIRQIAISSYNDIVGNKEIQINNNANVKIQYIPTITSKLQFTTNDNNIVEQCIATSPIDSYRYRGNR